jgi:two-component system sensor histidine kinase ChiS
MSPQQSFDFLNEYLRRVGPVVRRFAGMVDQYIGDGFMALFPGSPDDALYTAMELQAEIARFNVDLMADGQPPIALGIGLHTGRVMLGVIGEEERMQGTVISDAVNIAAHLERLTKVYGARILSTYPTVQQLTSRAQSRWRTLAVVKVKQRAEPITVIEFFDADPQPLADLKEATRPDFERGLESFNSLDFSTAVERFQTVLAASPEDAAAHLYLNRATYLLTNPAPPPFIEAV